MDNKEIKQKLSELANAKKTMIGIESKIAGMVTVVVHKDYPKIKAKDIYCPFTNECKKSPFGYCVYDEGKDSVWDHCIYCGKPYKRK